MRYIFSLIFITLSTLTSGQPQQGIVKTRGRMVNGKLVPGMRLNGATITLNFGNALVSDNNGTFSFNVPTGKNYSLVAAKKQGYTLAVPDYTRRSFKYSSCNPFYVVLEDEKQRQADINAARRNIQNTMSVQMEQKEKELETLKQQKIINDQEFERRIAELYDAQDKSWELVKTMAERYTAIDYDQKDEFYQHVQSLIEGCELFRADSLIRSKGDINLRIDEYHRTLSAYKDVCAKLEQSKNSLQKTYEDLSMDLYNKHSIYLQTLQSDSALYYLKLRADLDPTNISCQYDVVHLYYFEGKRLLNLSVRWPFLKEQAQDYFFESLCIMENILKLQGISSFRDSIDFIIHDIETLVAESY